MISEKQLMDFHLHAIADGLQKKENGKRRKEDHSSRKSKDKKVCGILIPIYCSLAISILSKLQMEEK